jgi:NADH-quinone oxidoreductase subunit K
MIPLSHYLLLSAILFGLSLAGLLLNRRSIIKSLVCIELLLLSANFNFIAFSHYFNDIAGQVMVFFVLTVAAAEAAVGLAIMVVVYRNRRCIDITALNELRG